MTDTKVFQLSQPGTCRGAQPAAPSALRRRCSRRYCAWRLSSCADCVNCLHCFMLRCVERRAMPLGDAELRQLYSDH